MKVEKLRNIVPRGCELISCNKIINKLSAPYLVRDWFIAPKFCNIGRYTIFFTYLKFDHFDESVSTFQIYSNHLLVNSALIHAIPLIIGVAAEGVSLFIQ